MSFSHFLVQQALWVELLIVLFLAFWIVEWFDRPPGVKALSTQEVVLLLNRQKTCVIDIRNEPAFKAGHLKKAKSYPALDVNEIKALEKYKKDTLILLSQTGITAKRLARKFKRLGFQHVAVLEGGMQAWYKESLPVEKEKGAK